MAAPRRLRVLCAPDSFKESVSAATAARAMADGARSAGPEVEADLCPVADGGEGTLDALVSAMGGTFYEAAVRGPLGEPRVGRYGVLADGRTGVVELAESSGLALVPRDLRDPTRTTTFGTGQLIRAAAERGCSTVIVGLGGSGTCDGGVGVAQALGARFFDATGDPLDAPLTGASLTLIARLEPPRDVPKIRVACDVISPLLGPRGAAAVYGPQKGATAEQVKLLEAGLAHLADLLGGDPTVGGAGAAGGAGFGLMAMCGGSLERGVQLVLDATGFVERCRVADLVLTGEGRLDAQTLNGKAVAGVAAAAHELGVSTAAIVGSTGAGSADCLKPGRGGFLTRVECLSSRFGAQRAIAETEPLIAELAREIVAAELARPRN